MTLKRRMGPESAATRTTLMDAVEDVMREQGYAALSARSVAARAGLKYQIVFYYFETMDDLLVATYRRSGEAMWVQIEKALDSERPLHAIWKMGSNPFDGALWLEFMAMANHNELIRAEKTEFGERVRRLMADRLSSQIRVTAPDAEVFTPFAISMAISCIGGILAFEDALGITSGHRETHKLVEWCLDRLEPPIRNSGRKHVVRQRSGRTGG